MGKSADSKGMSDHQDSDHFSYERNWVEIEDMLAKAEKVKNMHHTNFLAASKKQERLYHARNFKALEGVCKTLRWTLGDKNIKHPLD